MIWDYLPRYELEYLLESRFKAVGVDFATGHVHLVRLDDTVIIAPFSEFTTSGTGISPDFTRPEIIDYGATVRFGKYEAASDSIKGDLC